MPHVLVVFVGLPGVGKSTFARLLSKSLQSGLNVPGTGPVHAQMSAQADPCTQCSASTSDCQHVQVHTSIIDFDADLYLELEANAGVWNSDVWRRARVQSYHSIEQSLSSGGTTPRSNPNTDTLHVTIVDDNMFYRSMRRRCYNMAREANAGFLLVAVHASMETLLTRAETRPSQDYIPPDVISGMTSRMEWPGLGTEYSWEKDTININSSTKEGVDIDMVRYLPHVHAAIWHASHTPVPALLGEPPIQAQTFRDLLDQECRKMVTQVMSANIAVVRQFRSELGKRIALAKKGFMSTYTSSLSPQQDVVDVGELHEAVQGFGANVTGIIRQLCKQLDDP